MRLRAWGLGFIVKGLGLRAKGLSLACGYRAYGEEHLIACLLYGRSYHMGIKNEGIGFKVQ